MYFYAERRRLLLQRTKGSLLSPETTALSTNTSRPSDRKLNPLAYSQSPLTIIRHSISIKIMRSYSGIIYNKKDVLAVCSSFLLELDLWLVGWFFVWLVDWLVGWLVSLVCFIGWLVVNDQFSVVWLVGRSTRRTFVAGLFFDRLFFRWFCRLAWLLCLSPDSTRLQMPACCINGCCEKLSV